MVAVIAPPRVAPLAAPVQLAQVGYPDGGFAPSVVAPIMPQVVPNYGGQQPPQPMPMPAAIAAQQQQIQPQVPVVAPPITPPAAPPSPDTTAQQLRSVTAPVLAAMQAYKPAGSPFTAAAEGFVNAQGYREQQDIDIAKRRQAGDMFKGYPDIQKQVENGNLDIPSATSLMMTRAQRQGMMDYLLKNGHQDLAAQLAAGSPLDDVLMGLRYQDGGNDQRNLDRLNSDRQATGQPIMTMAQYLDAKKSGTFDSPQAANALPTVTLGSDGIPDPQAQKDYLDSLPNDQDRTMVQGVASYQIDPSTISLRNGERARIVALAKQLDPTYNSSQYKAASNMRQSITSGTYSQTLNSVNLAIQHAASLQDSFDKMGNQGGLLTPFNVPANTIKGATGDPYVKAANLARDGVATEIAKVFRGTGAMSEGEIDDWKKNFDLNTSPEGMHAQIAQAMTMLQARVDIIKGAYKNAMGKPQDFTFLTQQSVDALGKLGLDPSILDPMVQDGNAQDLTKGFTNRDGTPGKRFDPANPGAGNQAAAGGKPPAPDASNLPTVTTQADFDKLPSGTQYLEIGDDGQPHPFTKP